MSMIGWNGRALKVLKEGTVIAAIRSKTATHSREPVDVTTDDSDGDRTLLPAPALRAIDVAVEGVATSQNYQMFLSEWKNDNFLDISVLHADGSIEEAQEGFFLGNVEFTAEYNGAVMFTAQLMSSGPVTQSLS